MKYLNKSMPKNNSLNETSKKAIQKLPDNKESCSERSKRERELNLAEFNESLFLLIPESEIKGFKR